jgi:acetyl-CoA acyltransferase
MRDVFITHATRTPVGRIRGGLAPVRPDDLSAHVLRSLEARAGFDPADVAEVFWGCANQAGEDNRNVGRMAVVLADWPYSVPAVTVNRLCASGLEAVVQATRAIRTGDAELAVAGGVESMSRAPISMPKASEAFPIGNITAYDTTLGWRFPNPRMEQRFPLEAMGMTAENLVERYGISREDQDAFALASHQKAIAAQETGRFDAELSPVSIPQKKGAPVVVAADEGPRADTTLERLAGLPAVFKKGGTVTAGNSSTLNDGAAGLVLASEAAVAARGWEPMARIVAVASAGVDPQVMGIGPVPATRTALERAGLGVADLDLIELNEAFAAQSLAVMRLLELPAERVNVNGGAIALGHPLGCSGAKLLTTLVYELARRGGRYGLASLCVGVGQGLSVIVENLRR